MIQTPPVRSAPPTLGSNLNMKFEETIIQTIALDNTTLQHLVAWNNHFIILMDSVSQKFGEDIAVPACFYFIMFAGAHTHIFGDWCWLLAETSVRLLTRRSLTLDLSVWSLRLGSFGLSWRMAARFWEWVPGEESGSTWHSFDLALGVTWCHFYHILLLELVKKIHPGSKGRATDSVTQREECQGHLVRRTCAMGDIVATTCQNTLQWKSLMVFQSLLFTGERMKRRWRGDEGYSMS